MVRAPLPLSLRTRGGPGRAPPRPAASCAVRGARFWTPPAPAFSVRALRGSEPPGRGAEPLLRALVRSRQSGTPPSASLQTPSPASLRCAAMSANSLCVCALRSPCLSLSLSFPLLFFFYFYYYYYNFLSRQPPFPTAVIYRGQLPVPRSAVMHTGGGGRGEV